MSSDVKQMTQDIEKMSSFLLQSWPKLVTNGDLLTLLEIPNLRFRGPFVLCSFLNRRDTHIPIHIECPRTSLKKAHAIIAKHAQSVIGSWTSDVRNYHLDESTPSALDTIFVTPNNIKVFLFGTSPEFPDPLQTILDVYNVSFDSTGFRGSPHDLQNIHQKHCHLNQRLFKLLLGSSASRLERFFEVDCALLASMNFRVDWGSQRILRQIWKVLLGTTDEQPNIFAKLLIWNQRAFDQYNETYKIAVRPLLVLAVNMPFLKEELSIGNSLFGCAVTTSSYFRNAENTGVITTLPFHALMRDRSTPIVQVGELFSHSLRERNYLIKDRERMLLFDLFQENVDLRKPVALRVPANIDCAVYYNDDHEKMDAHLAREEDAIAVFQVDQSNTLSAFCYDVHQMLNFVTEVYQCLQHDDHTFVQLQQTYWEVPIGDDAGHDTIVITDQNIDLLRRGSSRYYFLVKLRREPMTFTHDDRRDRPLSKAQEASCQAPRIMFALVPVVVSNETGDAPQRATQRIFKRLYRHLKRKGFTVGLERGVQQQQHKPPNLQRHYSDASEQQLQLGARVFKTPEKKMRVKTAAIVISDSDDDVAERRLQREQHNSDND